MTQLETNFNRVDGSKVAINLINRFAVCTRKTIGEKCFQRSEVVISGLIFLLLSTASYKNLCYAAVTSEIRRDSV